MRRDRPELDSLVCFAKAIHWFREIIEAGDADGTSAEITVLSEAGLQRWRYVSRSRLLAEIGSADAEVDALIDEFLSPINLQA